ncbi:outer membrane protein OmpA-like peptidoglycan-associated protein [Paraburkholderia sp. BL21I4N1]|nr:outer membrane protein OmpA-like peptidoglycan-associated protein [Paraburkholderia sp. BL21I4N1]
MVLFGSALMLAVIWLVVPGNGNGNGNGSAAWILTAITAVAATLLVWRRARQLRLARTQGAQVLAALGTATAEIPARLRTRMPLVLVTGDDLPALFNRDGWEQFVHVGDGALWLRVDRPRDLPRLAVAVRQWRDGRAPDGIVLAIAPAQYADADRLTQALRLVRQHVADAARMLGRRCLPGYLAVYQRLTTGPAGHAIPQWYGVSSATHLTDAQRFESVIRAAESEVQHAAGDRVAAVRAAALASIVGWTHRVVVSALTDRQQPASPWVLSGAAWIDCGPTDGPGNPWEQDVEMQTRVMRATSAASAHPWPLPQPLIEALPQRFWMSPRWTAVAHVIAILACVSVFAFWGATGNNQTLLARIGADLGRYSMIPTAHDATKQDALRTLVADRDELDGYARSGVPLRLSLGMYRGTQLITPLNEAIASYVPPLPPPAVVTLDSMSLFDSGRARLKVGSTRTMVGALDMIKAHPDKRILIAGHTDNVGHPDSNLKLSTARADAVRDWLIEASGIPATRFAIQGYGDTRPLAENNTEAGRAKNRRVEITLVPDGPAAAPSGNTPRS